MKVPPSWIMLMSLTGSLVLTAVSDELRLGWLDWFATVLIWGAAMFAVAYRAGSKRKP